jgi:hypothetical protein
MGCAPRMKRLRASGARHPPVTGYGEKIDYRTLRIALRTNIWAWAVSSDWVYQ